MLLNQIIMGLLLIIIPINFYWMVVFSCSIAITIKLGPVMYFLSLSFLGWWAVSSCNLNENCACSCQSSEYDRKINWNWREAMTNFWFMHQILHSYCFHTVRCIPQTDCNLFLDKMIKFLKTSLCFNNN